MDLIGKAFRNTLLTELKETIYINSKCIEGYEFNRQYLIKKMTQQTISKSAKDFGSKKNS